MFEIYDGRKKLYQWDSEIRLIVDELTTEDYVHFTNHSYPEALPVKVYELDGHLVADVPNILLQTASDINVYAYVKDEKGNRTITDRTIGVSKRKKHPNYVYTPTEIANYEDIARKYEQNIHYQETLEEVSAALKPLVDDLKYITYNRKELLSEADAKEGSVFVEDGKIKILFSNIKSDVTLTKDQLEVLLRISLYSNKAYGAGLVFNINIPFNSTGGNNATGYIFFNTEVEYAYSSVSMITNAETKTSVIQHLLNPIPVFIKYTYADFCTITLTIEDEIACDVIIKDAINKANNIAYGVSAKLYNTVAVTISELSEALDIINGEVI